MQRKIYEYLLKFVLLRTLLSLVIRATKETFAIIYYFVIKINIRKKEKVEDCK
jgi:hypothetical protein